MKILVASYVYSYQKRYWWQLSSLVAQTPYQGFPVPCIHALASVCEEDPYLSYSDLMLDAFPWTDTYQPKCAGWHGVTLDRWLNKIAYGRRGLVRNKQLHIALYESEADWLLFNDADMVYHPNFFSHLGNLLATGQHEGVPYAECSKVLATYRDTMSFEDGYKVIDSELYDGCPIVNPYGKVQSLAKVYPASHHKISGAGFFQLVNVPLLRKRIREEPSLGVYVPLSRGLRCDADIFTPGASICTKSDIVFRKRLGGIVPIPCLPQIHINHYRPHDKGYKPCLH